VLAASDEEVEAVLSREELLALPAAQRRAGLEEWLRRRIGRAAGVLPARLPADRPLSDLGLDSLMAAEMTNDLDAVLGISLPTSALLAGSTLSQLVTDALENPVRREGGGELHVAIGGYLP
jgi:acyl carrier protein